MSTHNPNPSPTHTPLSPIRYDALILAGGRGTRMGNQDKGWVKWQDQALIEHMLGVLKNQEHAPRSIYISANRNQGPYENLGYLVLTDQRPSFQGPLAGIEQALIYLASVHTVRDASQNFSIQNGKQSLNSTTIDHQPPLLVLPCDTPLLPKQVFTKLYQGLDESTLATYATSPSGPHPLCCLVKPQALKALTQQLNQNQRRVMTWLSLIHGKPVYFESDLYFKNFNDAESLAIDF
jgi:molybdopterin-guanine dinucleotide biosynthesis protein A